MQRNSLVEEQLDVVSLLGLNYLEDLKFLRRFDFSIVTDLDLAKIKVMCMKYGIVALLSKDREKLSHAIGLLSNTIQKRFETYVKSHVIGKVIEETPDRLPTEPKTEKSRAPEDSWL